ncbi:hypothetical protein BGZ73_004235 [Actinomortierella ambigua]|nr:hypothetical protein BGZ73_004235 [Actinomortierella ambigua]
MSSTSVSRRPEEATSAADLSRRTSFPRNGPAHDDCSDNDDDHHESGETSPLLRPVSRGHVQHRYPDDVEQLHSLKHINQGSWRRMMGIFVLMVISYIVLAGIVAYKRLSLPAPVSAADATKPHHFSGVVAWEHLKQIAQRPHPINSRDNLRVYDYLMKTVRDLQQQAKEKNVTLEIGEDHVKLTTGKNVLGLPNRIEFYESSNVLVRVVGTEGMAGDRVTEKGEDGDSPQPGRRPDALLVDAHYDSVLIGHGATDDGIGVAVCLEMIRNLIQHPVRHNVIFNINNGEEVGLYGAAAFMKHPWAKDVRAFLNLGNVKFGDGAGAGGRALLFRSSNRALAGYYNKVGNSPHANVFGNDIFSLGLIKSATDYSVYTSKDYQLPGLDIAFYSRRAFYHTLRDDIEHTSIGSVQHMGNTALVALRGIADSDYLAHPEEIVSREASIYYDIAGLFMLSYSFSTYMTLNYNLLIAGIVFVAWAIISSRKHSLTFWVVLRGYLALILSFVAALATSFAFSKLITALNPMLVYREHWMGLVFCVFQCVTTVICVQWAWIKYESWRKPEPTPLDLALERIKVDSEQICNVSMVLFWWTYLAMATYLGKTKEIGMLYFVSWFMVCSMISAYLSLYPKRRGTFWTLTRLWVQAIPLIMIIDISATNAIAMSGTLVDGTPSFAILMLFSICALNCVMPLIPSLHRAANFRRMGLVTVIITGLLLLSALMVFPYSEAEAPNKLVWRQVYDLDTGSSLVSVKTMHHLEPIMDLVPDAQGSKRECGPDPDSQGVLQRCLYQGKIPKIVQESKKTGDDKKPLLAPKIGKPQHHKDEETGLLYRTTTVEWTIRESRLCRIQVLNDTQSVRTFRLEGFDSPTPAASRAEIQAATQELKEKRKAAAAAAAAAGTGARQTWRTVPESAMLTMIGFQHEFDMNWKVEVEYEVQTQHDPLLEVSLGCLYDEWDQGQIPAFTDMKNHLPPWALLGGGKGPGLLTIQTKISV